MTVITPDHLALEVEVPPVGLPNLIANPHGEFGAWGWLSDQADTLISPLTPDPGLGFVTTATQVCTARSEAFPVIPGNHVAARVDLIPFTGSEVVRCALAQLDADQTITGVVGTTATFPADTAATVYVSGGVVPGSVAYMQLVFQFNAADGVSAAPNGSGFAWDNAMVTTDTTDPGGAFAFVEPITWQDVTDPTIALDFDRQALDVGTLTALLRSFDLDPATTDKLRPGRAVRFTAAGHVLYRGRTLAPVAGYEKDKLTGDEFETRIQLAAVDGIAALSGQPEPRGVASLASLPFILEGKGVPWNINGATWQVFGAIVASMDQNASVLEQVALTRDTESGHAYLSREGVLTVTSDPEDSGVALSDAGTVVPVLAADDFTAADNANALSGRLTPVGGLAWTLLSSTWGISGNRAYHASFGTKAWVDAGQSDVTMDTDYTIGAGRNNSGIVVRWVSDSNNISIRANAGGWVLSKVVGGSTTVVDTAPGATINTTYNLRVVCSGSSVEVYIDGVLTLSGTIADAALLSATRYGFLSEGAADHFWDNFSVTGPPVELPSYTDIQVGLDPASVINILTVRLLDWDPVTETASETVSGPYRDPLSIVEWGPRPKTVTINGGSPAAFGPAVLAVNAVPAVTVESFTLAVTTTGDLATVAALEPSRTVDVTWNGTTYTVRILSVKHTIEPSTDMRRPVEWLATYECEAATTIARPWR